MSTLTPPRGYRLDKRLRATVNGSVYSAIREADGLPVVLKQYTDEGRGMARVRREFEVLTALGGAGSVRALALVEEGLRHPVLVLEQLRGLALSEWVRLAVPAPAAFVEIAVQLAQTLGHVHRARFLHRDLHPGNVMVDPHALEARLIDFGSARPMLRGLDRKDRSHSATGAIAGVLHFIAPEQTGRMDRGTDARSDLYGLGAMLYFALTGFPPFEGEDALALLHAHMARMPMPPIARRPDVPPTLSRIVLKLLQKEPEERYQTAEALHCDLLECRQQLQRTGRIDDDLVLGTADAPLRPLFPRRLYGRDAHIQALHGAYERAREGRPHWALLSGAPGTGKSALVHELRRHAAQTGGYLASGKFDLYRRDVPYSGWIGALESLAQQILVETEERLTLWREQLRSALGNIAGAIAELVPDVGVVLGEVPPVAPLGPREAHARLALAVRRLLEGCARPERPLVLFLDDLQWADPASRELLETLLHEGRGALLLLGAYRDSEVDASHPLAALLERVAAAGRQPERIALGDLDAPAAQQMLSDALLQPVDALRPLAEQVLRKTGGAPLLIQQFVLHLHALGLIRFEHPRGWTWDDAAIAAAPVPDGAVAILTAKLERLEPATRELIEFASCVGDEFTLEVLAQLSGRRAAELEPGLFRLLDEGLLAPSPRGLRFVHDRIREAAHGLVAASRQVELHRSMALLLHASTSPEELPEHAFELADHWNEARALLGEDERRQALGVNRVAGARARAAGASATAHKYFGAAVALFEEADWERDALAAFELFADAADAAHQVGQHDLALRCIESAKHRPLQLAQEVRLEARRIGVLLATDFGAAAEATVLALRWLGLRLPRRPSLLRVLASTYYTAWCIGDADEGVFRCVDTRERDLWKLRSAIVAAGGAALLQRHLLLLGLLSNRSLRAERRIGPGRSIASSLASFANGYFRTGGSWSRYQVYVGAARAWIERIPGPPHTRAWCTLQIFALGLSEPRRALAGALAETAEALHELGDLEYAGYARHASLNMLALSGEPLDALERAVPTRGRGFAAAPYALLARGNLAAIDWDAQLARAEQQLRGVSPLHMILPRLHWAIALCIGCQYERAWLELERFAGQVSNATATVGSLVDFALFRGLCAAARLPDAPRSERRHCLRVLRRCLRQVQIWGRRSADFAHMPELLGAEQARARGRIPQALYAYTRCAQRAHATGVHHHAALAHERRASLLLERSRKAEALIALREARDLYRQWGAGAKVEQLERLAAERAILEGAGHSRY